MKNLIEGRREEFSLTSTVRLLTILAGKLLEEMRNKQVTKYVR